MVRPLALTMGEPAGIGGEIAMKAWLRRGEGTPPFYLIDAPERLADLARQFGRTVQIKIVDDRQAAVSAFAKALPVVPVGGAPVGKPGHPDPRDQPLVLRALEIAVADARAGRAAALVTNPINKDAL